MRVFALLLVSVLFGCGEVVDIPTASVGKLSTPSGIGSGIIEPGKIRLDWEGFRGMYDSIILVEAKDFAVQEEMVVFMPQDTLNMMADVRGTLSIDATEKNINAICSRISPKNTSNHRIKAIDSNSVYTTYVQPILREVCRNTLSKHSIQAIMEDRDGVSRELERQCRERLAGVPVKLLWLGLADVQPPAVIVAAQEAAKEREIAIQKAEADKAVAIKTAEAALEVAIKQQEVDLKEAETQVMVEQKLSGAVTQAFVTQRALKVMERLATSNNKVIILPFEALQNPAMLTGVSQNVLQEKP